MQKSKKLLKKAYECGMSVGAGVMMLFFGAWFVIIGYGVNYGYKRLGVDVGLGMSRFYSVWMCGLFYAF